MSRIVLVNSADQELPDSRHASNLQVDSFRDIFGFPEIKNEDKLLMREVSTEDEVHPFGRPCIFKPDKVSILNVALYYQSSLKHINYFWEYIGDFEIRRKAFIEGYIFQYDFGYIAGAMGPYGDKKGPSKINGYMMWQKYKILIKQP